MQMFSRELSTLRPQIQTFLKRGFLSFIQDMPAGRKEATSTSQKPGD